jgi:hypothetical protein
MSKRQRVISRFARKSIIAREFAVWSKPRASRLPILIE